jgi:FkbM family methyltransferase
MKKSWLFLFVGVVGIAVITLRIGLSGIKDFFIRSTLADLYVKYVRDGDNFDADHVITHLDNGMRIIVNKHDRCVCWFTRLTGHLDSNETRVLEKIIQKDFRIIEVGANFGVHTLRMAELVGKNGKVYAFEANPSVSKYLKASVGLNQLDGVITVFEKAAGNKPGEAFLDFGIANIGGGHIVSDGSTQSVRTEIVRLDDAIEQDHVDLLKIDAEGYELKIIQGAKDIIDRNVDHIILMLEFVPSHLKRQGTSPKELLQFLKDKGFSLWRVGKKNLNEPILVSTSMEELLNMSETDIVASRRDLSVD